MQQNPLLFDTQHAPSTATKQMKEVAISKTPLLYKLDAILVSWRTGL